MDFRMAASKVELMEFTTASFDSRCWDSRLKKSFEAIETRMLALSNWSKEPTTEPAAIRKLRAILGTGKSTEPVVIATVAVIAEEGRMWTVVETEPSIFATKVPKLEIQAGIELMAVEWSGFELSGNSLKVQDLLHFATKVIDYALDDGPDKNYGSEEPV